MVNFGRNGLVTVRIKTRAPHTMMQFRRLSGGTADAGSRRWYGTWSFAEEDTALDAVDQAEQSRAGVATVSRRRPAPGQPRLGLPPELLRMLAGRGIGGGLRTP